MAAEVRGTPVVWGFTSPFHLTTAPLVPSLYHGALSVEINEIPPAASPHAGFRLVDVGRARRIERGFLAARVSAVIPGPPACS